MLLADARVAAIMRGQLSDGCLFFSFAINISAIAATPLLCQPRAIVSRFTTVFGHFRHGRLRQRRRRRMPDFR